MNRLEGKTYQQRVTASTLFNSGVTWTIKELQIELGGAYNALKYAVSELVLKGDIQRVGEYRFKRHEPHWIHKGKLAGDNLVRCPQ